MVKKEKRLVRGKKRTVVRTPVRSKSVFQKEDTQTAVLDVLPETIAVPAETNPPVLSPGLENQSAPDTETLAASEPGVQAQSESASKQPAEKEGAETSLVVDEKMELLGFSMNLEEYAIPVSQIKEIIRVTDMTVIPGSSPILLGIISLRGVIIPVFKLANKLANLKLSELEMKVQDEHEKLRRIIIIQIEQGYFGLMVDGVTDVIKITDEEIKPPPPLLNQMGQEMIRGIATFKNRLIILLFIERIVDVIQNEMNVIRTT